MPERDPPEAERVVRVDERNLGAYHLGKLWNGSAFLDQAWNQTVVANKNATTLEALLLLERLTGRDLSTYVRGAADLIVRAQVREPGPRSGGTVHLGTGADALVIAFYTARCVGALAQLLATERHDDARYRDALDRAVRFLVGEIRPDGLNFGYHRDGREIDRKSTRLNSSHANISYAVFCLKKKRMV